MTCLEEMEKDPAARDSGQGTAAAGGRAMVLPRDQVATAYARTAVRRHPISEAFPVMGSNAPSVEPRWCGSSGF